MRFLRRFAIAMSLALALENVSWLVFMM
jgi:hypothetical protein